MFIIKQPSPSMKPVSHSGWGISCKVTIGLGTGVIFGKACFSFSDIPKFKLTLKLIIFSKFSKEIFRLLALMKTICLNNSKSALFVRLKDIFQIGYYDFS